MIHNDSRPGQLPGGALRAYNVCNIEPRVSTLKTGENRENVTRTMFRRIAACTTQQIIIIMIITESFDGINN